MQIHLDSYPTSNRDHMRCITNTDDVAHLFFGWRMEGRTCLFRYSLPSHTSCMLEESCWSKSPCLHCRAELYHAFYRPSKFHLGSKKGFALSTPTEMLHLSLLTQMHSFAFYIQFLLGQNCLCLTVLFLSWHFLPLSRAGARPTLLSFTSYTMPGLLRQRICTCEVQGKLSQVP